MDSIVKSGDIGRVLQRKAYLCSIRDTRTNFKSFLFAIAVTVISSFLSANINTNMEWIWYFTVVVILTVILILAAFEKDDIEKVLIEYEISEIDRKLALKISPPLTSEAEKNQLFKEVIMQAFISAEASCILRQRKEQLRAVITDIKLQKQIKKEIIVPYYPLLGKKKAELLKKLQKYGL